MNTLLPLANAHNYIKKGSRYTLSGNRYLALPGCIADDPEKGALLYNDQLINHYMLKSSKRIKRLKNIASKFSHNRRVKKITRIIKAGVAFNLSELSKMEKSLLIALLSQ